jgi:hypothetical protein
MFRAFLRSTAPIALLLVLGLCSLSAVLVLPASTSTVTSDGVETTSGPDTSTVILVGGLLVIGVLAFVTAGFLTYRRRRSGRS